ncbi:MULTISPECIES: class I SAM-dependent methyltransferase [Alphaproteobacteria]|uniref:Methyltransferase n=2 Tax=Alphaproteobacteria TaxID=28211 RepID=A0A512HDF8_9HYPH|nr:MULTISPECIES: class I SAM-dependent methyltransferase [Alphaproteobacteria]GEO83494.1 methyltransferase [Ciceribacter naphthalenivorans]GLR24355.1 methyltransferase [Ciceribacter naphthalenivorans]GLT07211.1 methyltransferase [Sphingomonas psychrolutea]
MRKCPLCLSANNVAIVERARVPVLQNVIVRTRAEALEFPTGRLSICGCQRCGFVWNDDFDPAAIDYGATYNNSVQASGVYLAHQAAMVDRVLKEKGDLHYLEIGCGEGEFIDALEKTGRLKTAIGFDPAFHGNYAFGPHITIFREYFDADSAVKVPDTINTVCSRHTIEHVPDPRAFVAEIAKFVKERKVRLLMETPDVTWILRRAAFEDFFYEHCSLYSPRSIQYLLAEFGLKCTVDLVYDGQYMWIEASPADNPPLPVAVTDFADGVAAGLAQALENWRAEIDRLRERGPLAIWGAASKGVTFALLLEGIDYAIDLNVQKQGGFLPVSAVPVVGPEAARHAGVSTIVVMNPIYETEIRSKVEEMGWNALVISLRAEAPGTSF